MDIDEHLADEERRSGLLLGDRAVPLSPESEHLADDADADFEGTTDVGNAIESAAIVEPAGEPDARRPGGHGRCAGGFRGAALTVRSGGW